MGETESGRRAGGTSVAVRILLAIGFVIAIAATALVIISTDVRMLRIAVVLALWAALIAAFAVTRSRRDARAAVSRGREAEMAYQVELQREVAARREYEADLTKQVAQSQSEQIAELRSELSRLSDVLSAFAEGDFMVSRLTLSAESARFRAGQLHSTDHRMMTESLQAAGRGLLGLGHPDTDEVDVILPSVGRAPVEAPVDPPAMFARQSVVEVDPPSQPEEVARPSEPVRLEDAPYHRPDPEPAASYRRPDPEPAASYRRPDPEPAASYHRPDPEPAAPYHRPDPEPAASYHRPDPEPAASYHRPEHAQYRAETAASRAEPGPDDASSSDETDVSVADLLAAYGLSGSGRRRRRSE